VEIILKDIAELEIAVRELLAFAETSPTVSGGRGRKKMIFIGEIGAGKTTFIKALCAQLGVEEKVTSPTFSLVNQYSYFDKEGHEQLIYHLDLYRLKNREEALDIGIEDILYEDAYCFIEWPELIEDLLPDNIVKISIEIVDDSTRKILFL